jgi:hypothetical protein
MEGDLDLKVWWGLPRTRIELSVEDTLDFRAFEITGGVFETDVLDRKCKNEQVETKFKGESKPNSKE